MDGIWKDLQRLYKSSVVQISATRGSFNLSEPYMSPAIAEAKGSGFLISREGHILTNAHVVESAITVSFRAERAGNRDLHATLIALSPNKDVALLKASPEALAELGAFKPFEFGDDQKLEQMQPVMTISFPLGSDRIKFTSGVVSGYEAQASESGSQSYIQIDAPVSPGSSGSPLLNSDGQVIGICSAGIAGGNAQNTNFAIPSRVVFSVMRELFAREGNDEMRKVVCLPSLGLAFQRITEAHFRMLGIDRIEDQKGLRVKEIIPGCPFPEVQVDDIVQLIRYADPYNVKNAFDVTNYMSEKCTRCSSQADKVIEISSTGSIKVYDMTKINRYGDPTEVQFTRDRKVSLQEVIDTIPIDTVLILEVFRPSSGSIGMTSGPFRNRDGLAIHKLYPPFDKLEYVLFGGAVFIPLSTNVLEPLGATKYLCKYNPYQGRYRNRVIITKIFPLTSIRDIDCINPTEVVESVNDVKIETIQDLQEALLVAVESNLFISIKFESDKVVVLDPLKAIDQDKKIHEQFQIRANEFSELIWQFDQ